jgi:hypothetical protein
MSHNPVPTASSWLTLGAIVVSLSAAGAAADTQDPVATVADWETYGRRPIVNTTNMVSRREERNAVPVERADADISTGARTTLQNGRQPVSIPCLHGMFNHGSIEDHVRGNDCTEPPEEQGNLSIQFDRHIGAGGGILGDVDGVRLDYRLSGGLSFNGVAGYPALSAADKFNTSRRLLGISTDLAKFAQSWDFNSYVI